jgi:xanthine dehydrogenase accessory factor
MAVAIDGELIGSIGGGVMEVSLVEHAKELLSATQSGRSSEVREQVHRKDTANASGMICSGEQTVIFKELAPDDLATVERAISSVKRGRRYRLTLSADRFNVGPPGGGTQNGFERSGDSFIYTEIRGDKNQLYIIGGGHCALALSELMSKLGFRISIYDDRPSLNTLEKNEFADDITVIESYDKIAAHIPKGDDVYVVVMTLGYASDAVVIRRLVDHDVKYLGVLGSKAKMTTLMRGLKQEGFEAAILARIHTPIGVPINSRTPEEIAVSIAAEIISVKNR